MATEAARLKAKDPPRRKNKTDLTLTGLLMEGLGRESDHHAEVGSFPLLRQSNHRGSQEGGGAGEQGTAEGVGTGECKR